MTYAEAAINQYVEEWYEAQIPTIFDKFVDWLNGLFCKHEHYMLVMYELRKSKRPVDKSTSREYQYIQLRASQQYWKCSCCGKHSERSEAL